MSTVYFFVAIGAVVVAYEYSRRIGAMLLIVVVLGMALQATRKGIV